MVQSSVSQTPGTGLPRWRPESLKMKILKYEKQKQKYVRVNVMKISQSCQLIPWGTLAHKQTHLLSSLLSLSFTIHDKNEENPRLWGGKDNLNQSDSIRCNLLFCLGFLPTITERAATKTLEVLKHYLLLSLKHSNTTAQWLPNLN